MHEISKRKEKEPLGKDAVMVLQQHKHDNSFMFQGIKSCLYCGKLGHIVRFYCKTTKQKTRKCKECGRQ